MWILKTQYIHLEQKNNRLLNYLLGNICFYQFVHNFSVLLLCKINVYDIFNMIDLFLDFWFIAKYWNPDEIKLSKKVTNLFTIANFFYNFLAFWIHKIISNMIDFSKILGISQNTEVLLHLKFWLRMYWLNIFKRKQRLKKNGLKNKTFFFNYLVSRCLVFIDKITRNRVLASILYFCEKRILLIYILFKY